jgi:methionine biosynthesis protein MetW
MSKELPHQWYNTPNVHVLTINDFEKYCSNYDLRILERIVISEGGQMVTALPNLLGAVAIYRFNKG